MAHDDKIQLFEDKRIRTAWDEEKEEWYFSIVDVVGVLTDQPDARHASTYWAVLKKRLNEEGANELLTDCKQFKMTATDGKKRLTDVADTEQLLRIIQSIPSPKAEPFKMWLAQVGRERIEETIDPELTIERALETYLKKGYTREWINQRLQAIQVRKELTDEWDARGVQKGVEYAILTDEISRAWSGMLNEGRLLEQFFWTVLKVGPRFISKALLLQGICCNRRSVRIWTPKSKQLKMETEAAENLSFEPHFPEIKLLLFPEKCVLILLWCFKIQSGMWAFLIIESNVFVNLLSQFSLGAVSTAVKLFLLEHGKERFHYGVVMGCSRTGKRLRDL